MNIKSWIWIGVLVGGVFYFLFQGLSEDPKAVPILGKREALPEFSLNVMASAGETMTQEDFLGHWTLLNVWSTWCRTCKAEHPTLLKIAKGSVPIVGVNYKELDGAVYSYLKRFGNPYQKVLMDSKAHLAHALGVYGVPQSFLIDPKGRIAWRRIGGLRYQRWQKEALPIVKQHVREDD